MKTQDYFLISMIFSVGFGVCGCQVDSYTPMMDAGKNESGKEIPPIIDTPTGGMVIGGSMVGGSTGGAPGGGGDLAGMMGGSPVEGGEEAGNVVEAGEALGGEEIGGEAFGGSGIGCIPEDDFGPCAVCDDNGELSIPDTDPRCPLRECPEEYYELDNDGQCLLLTQAAPTEIECIDYNECLDPEDQLCEVVATEVIAGGSTCSEITTCGGTEPPEIAPKPDGVICNEWGTCQNGVCSAPELCIGFDRYNMLNFYCGEAADQDGNPLCAFYVSGTGLNNNGRVTCTDFCARSGATCVSGWNNANDSNCNRQGAITGCDVDFETQICLCSVP